MSGEFWSGFVLGVLTNILQAIGWGVRRLLTGEPRAEARKELLELQQIADSFGPNSPEAIHVRQQQQALLRRIVTAKRKERPGNAEEVAAAMRQAAESFPKESVDTEADYLLLLIDAHVKVLRYTVLIEAGISIAADKLFEYPPRGFAATEDEFVREIAYHEHHILSRIRLVKDLHPDVAVPFETNIIDSLHAEFLAGLTSDDTRLTGMQLLNDVKQLRAELHDEP